MLPLVAVMWMYYNRIRIINVKPTSVAVTITSARAYCDPSYLLVCEFVNMWWVRIFMSRKQLEIKARLQWYIWNMANQIVTWSMTSRDLLRAGGDALAWRRLQSTSSLFIVFLVIVKMMMIIIIYYYYYHNQHHRHHVQFWKVKTSNGPEAKVRVRYCSEAFEACWDI